MYFGESMHIQYQNCQYKYSKINKNIISFPTEMNNPEDGQKHNYHAQQHCFFCKELLMIDKNGKGTFNSIVLKLLMIKHFLTRFMMVLIINIAGYSTWTNHHSTFSLGPPLPW